MTALEKVVVDASVVVKWYVPEVASGDASRLLDGTTARFAPDLLVAEFGNVLWKKVRKGELSDLEAHQIAEGFVSACPVALHALTPYLRSALEIATRRQCTVYDALYLALALSEGCQLATADARLANLLAGTELEGVVRLLRQE